MFDIKKEVACLFGSITLYYEAFSVVDITCNMFAKNMPSQESVISFIKWFMPRDSIKITFTLFENTICSQNPNFENDYHQFTAACEQEDIIEIGIKIDKQFDSSNSLSVFCYDDVEKFLLSKNPLGLMQLVARHLKDRPYIHLQIWDQKIELHTKSISLGSEHDKWITECFCRKEVLTRYAEISAFYGRVEMPLIPIDFKIVAKSGHCGAMEERFNQIETILSYLYLSNSSYIRDNNLFLQLLPTREWMIVPFSVIAKNTAVCELALWGFGSEFATERIGIIRNLLALRCKNQEDIIGIDSRTLSEAKSNYIIYQKRNIEQYIKLKNQISGIIVDASKQLQEISHSLVDALKNNFMAILMFFLTVILTDSIDWDVVKVTGELFDWDLIVVIKIFVATSLIYLLITLISTVMKWKFFITGYNQLKNNYRDIFDESDLRDAFNNDELIAKMRLRIIAVTIIISLIWGGFLRLVYIAVSAVKYL